MAKELNILEEFDILSELQFPDYIYSLDSEEEKFAFSNYIRYLSGRRILLLHDRLFSYPFAVASLREIHIEEIFKNGGYAFKKMFLDNLSDLEFLKQVSDFVTELDKRGRTTENSTKLKNILQYLKDNKHII